ncbi:MAG: hypothetical protein ABL959_14660 [Pyrinomonadaceae bacterium]
MRHDGCSSVDTRVVDSRLRDGRTWRKRVCPKCRKQIFTFEITAKEYELFREAKKLQSELSEPQWAVITSDGVKANYLIHAEAVEMVEKLRGLHDSGLTIVTSTVAERLKDENRNT